MASLFPGFDVAEFIPGDPWHSELWGIFACGLAIFGDSNQE